MKIDKKSLFLGISLGAISTAVIFLSFGDVNTDFSFQIGDNIRSDLKKDINISIEKTIENGIEKVTVIVNARGDVLKEDVEKELIRVFKENNINKDDSNINIDININS
ncbi:MAG: hypothetical protein P8O00_05705 [Candidatus Marinimicrobia bacterium]|nr:hypothetical protein [Candidatus Neomarinimicrobiota bacterium]